MKSEERVVGIVYGLHNGDHNYRYIGQTKQGPKKRMYSHRSYARNGDKRSLYEWFREEGIDNIQISAIETFTQEDLWKICERERFHIANALNNEKYPGEVFNFDERKFEALKQEARDGWRKETA